MKYIRFNTDALKHLCSNGENQGTPFTHVSTWLVTNLSLIHKYIYIFGSYNSDLFWNHKW